MGGRGAKGTRTQTEGGQAGAISVARGPAITPMAQIQSDIRAAYDELNPHGRGGWVNLADIRDLISGYSKQEVDEALRDLARGGSDSNATIIPDANQKMLTPRDREGAVLIGGQQKHLIQFWRG